MASLLVPSDNRSNLMSNAAVERGRVNNALDKLRQVEAEFSKFQFDAANEKRKLQQQLRFFIYIFFSIHFS